MKIENFRMFRAVTCSYTVQQNLKTLQRKTALNDGSH